MVDKREITPELLTRLTVIMFTEVRIEDVLKGKLQFYALSSDDVARLMIRDRYFRESQSQDSCKAYAKAVIDYVAQKTYWQDGRKPVKKGYLNVFDLLLLTLKDLLVMNQNHIDFRYEEILSWRMLVRHMGEELALSARYALWDHEHSEHLRSRFDEYAWPYVTAHNNKQLNMIVHRGVSDHHCHLWGSTPYFHVSWINLMNRVTNSLYQRNLQGFSPVKWSSEEISKRQSNTYDGDMDKHYGTLAQIRAAWIRLYLCELLAPIERPCDEKEYAESVKNKRASDLKAVMNYDNWRVLLLSQERLESELITYTHCANDMVDYALAIAALKKPTFSSEYHVLIGERWLYYQIFSDYCKPPKQRRLKDRDYNLFFIYYLIRLWIRKKMVQNNDIIGFDNFQQIQRRKANFLGDSESERILTRLAVNEALKKPFVRELEVRIAPDVAQVKRLENAINSKVNEDRVSCFLADLSRRRRGESTNEVNSSLKDRYYYVFHFLKQRSSSIDDDPAYERSLKTGRICRDGMLRQKYMDQAKEIIRFREQQPLLAQRVLGIDAASRELDCRPEVFGTVYRLLGDHQFTYGGYTERPMKLPALGKTYHVAEDFPDIVDGLRAIDEAINFLDFDCGDRLGHALALGVNVEDWYDQKHYSVTVSVQNYLDNLAWLYHALNHFSISNMDTLKPWIIKEFEYWFRIVYRNSVSDEQLQRLMFSAQEWYTTHAQEDHGRYHPHRCHFDIMDYYRAWALRGDDPSCYIDGYFKKPHGSSMLIFEKRCRVNEKFPPSFDDRYVPEYSLLNHLYLFHNNVWREGARQIKVDISHEYIQAVKAVQIEMRYRVARKGIAIETNPTSNVLIGTFRKYEKHPISVFYNRGLLITEEEERECAQLQVSINTDDSGVFYTDLETEYALLARSAEQIEDENGKLRFKKADIYTWLDNIRVMGNEQTFRELNLDE